MPQDIGTQNKLDRGSREMVDQQTPPLHVYTPVHPEVCVLRGSFLLPPFPTLAARTHTHRNRHCRLLCALLLKTVGGNKSNMSPEAIREGYASCKGS